MFGPVAGLIIGAVVKLPKETQNTLLGWCRKDRQPDGTHSVDVCLTIGGVEVPFREYAESLYNQLDKKAWRLVRDKAHDAFTVLEDKFLDVTNAIDQLLTTKLTYSDNNDEFRNRRTE